MTSRMKLICGVVGVAEVSYGYPMASAGTEELRRTYRSSWRKLKAVLPIVDPAITLQIGIAAISQQRRFR